MNAATNRLFSICRKSKPLVVLDAATGKIVQTLPTKPGQKTMVHRGAPHRIYLSGADYQADGKTPVPGTFGVYVYGPATNE